MFLHQTRYRGWSSRKFPGDDVRGDGNHPHITYFGNQRNGPGSTGIGFEHVYLAILDGILHVHQTFYMHLFRNLSGVLLDGLHIFRGNVKRWDDTGRVSGVDTCQLDMLHDSRHKGMFSVTDGIRLTLQGIVEETVNQDRAVRCHTNRCFHVIFHGFIIVDYFHTAASQYVGRTNHNGVANLICDGLSFLHGSCHAGFRHRNLKLIHHGTEMIPVLCKVNNCRGGTQDLHTVFLQVCSQVQWSLATELGDNAQWLFFIIYTQYIF